MNVWQWLAGSTSLASGSLWWNYGSPVYKLDNATIIVNETTQTSVPIVFDDGCVIVLYNTSISEWKLDDVHCNKTVVTGFICEVY